MAFIFHFIYGIIPTPLTNSYFSRWWLHHQADIICLFPWGNIFQIVEPTCPAFTHIWPSLYLVNELLFTLILPWFTLLSPLAGDVMSPRSCDERSARLRVSLRVFPWISAHSLTMVYGRYIMIYLYLMDLNGVYKLITGVAQACTICGYTLGFYGCCYIYIYIYIYAHSQLFTTNYWDGDCGDCNWLIFFGDGLNTPISVAFVLSCLGMHIPLLLRSLALQSAKWHLATYTCCQSMYGGFLKYGYPTSSKIRPLVLEPMVLGIPHLKNTPYQELSSLSVSFPRRTLTSNRLKLIWSPRMQHVCLIPLSRWGSPKS